MSPKIPLHGTECQLEEKGSRFISQLVPLAQENDVRILQQQARDAHPKASHVVYGWRLITDKGQISEGFSDDGEPSGTSGMPVLRQLQHENAVNSLILVVRYFGGTKLGTGGLQRAYSQAARDALALLNAEDWVHWKARSVWQLNADFSQEGLLRRLLQEAGAEITGCDYSNTGIRIDCVLNDDCVGNVKANLPFDIRLIQADRD